MSPRLAARLGDAGLDTVLGALPAAAVGYALANKPSLTVPILAAAAVVWLLVVPSLAAVAFGAAIPALQDVTHGRLGVHVAASDLLMVLLAAKLLGDAAVSHRFPALRALRPVRLPVLQYAACIGLLLAIHPSFTSLLKSAQRLELLLLPLLVGAALALRRHHLLALRAYIVASTFLAVAWPLHLIGHAELQKNPTGQLLANAILLLVAVPEFRKLLPFLPVLAVGLLLTGSRGAILALLLGVAVLAVLRGGRSRRVVVGRVLPIAATALIAFQWLPTDVRTHVTELHASTGTAAGYSIYVRDQYQQDASKLIAAHPWTGVGVGNYLSSDTAGVARAADPHDVILLQATEGGYLFAAAFVLLVLGALLAVWRLRLVQVGAAAIAVLVATVAHGFVDVYWVRGTPVLGWMLVGMACGLAARGAEREA